eukprot:scaffold32008_cov107-Isochrysis_galbana.AAC.4
MEAAVQQAVDDSADELRRLMLQLGEQSEVLLDLRTELRNAVERAETAERELEVLRPVLSKAEGTTLQVKADLKAARDLADSGTAALAHAQATVTEIQRLSADHARAEALAKVDATSAAAGAEALRVELARTQQHLSDAQSELVMAELAVSHGEETIAELEEEVQCMARRGNEAGAALAAMSAELAQVKEKVQLAFEEAEKAQAEAERSEAQARVEKDKAELSVQEAEKAKEEADDANARVGLAKREAEEARYELAQARIALERAHEETMQAMREADWAKADAGNSRLEAEQARGEAKQAQTEADRTVGNLSAAISANESAIATACAVERSRLKSLVNEAGELTVGLLATVAAARERSTAAEGALADALREAAKAAASAERAGSGTAVERPAAFQNESIACTAAVTEILVGALEEADAAREAAEAEVVAMKLPLSGAVSQTASAMACAAQVSGDSFGPMAGADQRALARPILGMSAGSFHPATTQAGHVWTMASGVPPPIVTSTSAQEDSSSQSPSRPCPRFSSTAQSSSASLGATETPAQLIGANELAAATSAAQQVKDVSAEHRSSIVRAGVNATAATGHDSCTLLVAGVDELFNASVSPCGAMGAEVVSQVTIQDALVCATSAAPAMQAPHRSCGLGSALSSASKAFPPAIECRELSGPAAADEPGPSAVDGCTTPDELKAAFLQFGNPFLTIVPSLILAAPAQGADAVKPIPPGNNAAPGPQHQADERLQLSSTEQPSADLAALAQPSVFPAAAVPDVFSDAFGVIDSGANVSGPDTSGSVVFPDALGSGDFEPVEYDMADFGPDAFGEGFLHSQDDDAKSGAASPVVAESTDAFAAVFGGGGTAEDARWDYGIGVVRPGASSTAPTHLNVPLVAEPAAGKSISPWLENTGNGASNGQAESPMMPEAVEVAPPTRVQVESVDRRRCMATHKLKAICLCDTCKDPNTQALGVAQDEEWAKQRQREKSAELAALRAKSGGDRRVSSRVAGLDKNMAEATSKAAITRIKDPPMASGNCWRLVSSADGTPHYFYNVDSHETAWQLPGGAVVMD